MKAKLLLIIGVFFSTVVVGQSVKTLEYNVGTGTFTGLLPFDQPFNLRLINIPKGADSVQVKLIEVPKKNYRKIADWKKTKKLNHKEITGRELLNWKPSGTETYYMLLDSMIKGKTFIDTFYNLPVPFYLKPESKYLLDVECYIKTELSETELNKLETDIKSSRLYKNIINGLIVENITDPDASSINWGDYAIKLQNAAQQIVKEKHRNYVINNPDYEEQLKNLSGFLINLRNINKDIVDVENYVKSDQKSKAQKAWSDVNQRHKALTDAALKINWPKVKKTDAAYTKLIQQVNATLAADSALVDKNYKPILANTRKNIISTLTKKSNAVVKADFDVVFKEINSAMFSSITNNESKNVSESMQRHNSIIRILKNLNWPDLTPSGAETVFKSVEEAFSKDEKLVESENVPNITDSKENIKRELTEVINAKDALNNGLAHFIAVNTTAQGNIGSTNSESLLEQAKLHVTFDLGYAYIWQVDRTNAYAGINIYFRSIDTSLPLKNYKRSFIDLVGSRTSLLIGLSVQSIQKDSVRKGIIGNNALVTGLGFRLLPWFKINGGAYMYYLYSSNPLRTKNDYSFKASPFVSLSIDFNLSSFFETFGNGGIANIFKK